MKKYINMYKSGLISIGKMAELLNISKDEAMNLLNRYNIDWLEVDEKELNRQVELASKFSKRTNAKR